MDVEQRGTVIDVRFPEHRVHIRAVRISDKDEYFKAELVVKAELAMGDTSRTVQLNRSRVDMLDDFDKDKLISTLQKATEEYPYLSWGNMIHDAFNGIMDKKREGVPAELMDELDNFTPRTYAVYPLFVRGVANLMWAPGGSAKSYFGLLSCVLIDRGISEFGLRAPKGNALYLDWEEEPDVFRQRLFAVQKGLNIQNPETSGIYYKKMMGSLVSNIEGISRTVIDKDITYVVIDSVGAALGGNSIDQQVVEDYFTALRILNVTSVSIDHANRAGETTGNWAIHGSAFKYARARQVYELKKVQEADSGELQVVMYHRKTNDSGNKSPRGFKVKFDMVENYNQHEDDYEKHLDKVVFETLGLGDADNELLRTMTLGEICRELIKTNGPSHIDSLRANLAIIKDNDISDDVIHRTIENSTILKLEGDIVSFVQTQEEKQWDVS